MSNPSIIETFENPYPDREYIIEHSFPEFTSVCPKTGQPDFGSVTITYVAGPKCVELKSLKFYLTDYRARGIFYEAVTNKILEDLVAVCRPRRMTVVTTWRPRGGLTSTITAGYEQAGR